MKNFAFALKLRAARKKTCLTQKETSELLSKELGEKISFRTYQHWETMTEKENRVPRELIQRLVLETLKKYENT